MDATIADLAGPGTRERTEEAHIAQLNRRPLTITVTEDEVRIAVRFHVRFENRTHANRYGELADSVRAGIRLIWNQRMSYNMLEGRRFEVVAEFGQVAPGAARSLDHWLITVRPNDNDVATYERCALPPTDQGVPTFVTYPTCDGGVMSIPPSHIGRAGVLGHETMHLFGLVDRYMSIISRPRGRRPVVENDPMRETGGRPDPLGTQDARILPEDLGYLLDRLGIDGLESERGLSTLRRLERGGLTVGAVIGEIHRLREIIAAGRDTRSLIRIRTDFRDRMERLAEDL